jgi:dienelactone hydrolase
MRFLSAALIATLFFSCGTEADTGKTAAVTKDSVAGSENFEKGKILHVQARSADESYELYLPSNFIQGKKYPLLLALDPHADGKIPCEKYAAVAEKYGYILAASNNSKNGIPYEQAAGIVERALTDLSARLPVDTRRIYLTGFSGGSRVAHAYTIAHGNINGVICCGASYPATKAPVPRTNYNLITLCGNADLNFTEMRKYHLVDLASYRIKHRLQVFEGKHEWPSEDVMSQAVWWMELNQMRADGSVLKADQIADSLTVKKQIAEKLQNENKNLELYHHTIATINFYEQLGDLTMFYNLYSKFKSDPEVDKMLKAEEAGMAKEEAMRGRYIKAFSSENLAWWKKELAMLRKKSSSTKDRPDALIHKRMLEYMSLACYMQVNGALSHNDVQAADYFSELYVMTDPDNKEAYYLRADVLALQGKSSESISMLKSAIEKGFDDDERIKSDRAFDGIRNSEEFKKAISETGKN